MLGFSSASNFEAYANTVHNDVFNLSDFYASDKLDLKNVVVSTVNGYGLYGENGIGFSFSANDCEFWYNKKAAVYTSGHHSSIIRGSITRCGTDNDLNTGGVIVDKGIYYSPNDLIIEQVEFDNNENYHIWVKSLVNGNISYNRFVCDEEEEDVLIEELKTPIGIKVADYSNEEVQNLTMKGNYFRTQHENNYPFTAFELDNNIHNSIFTQNYMLDNQNTTQLTSYNITNGFEQNNNLVVHEGEIIVTDNLTPSFSVDLRNSNQSVAAGISTRLDWDHIRNDNYDNFNVDLTSNDDYYLTALSGNWNFNAKVSFTGALIGDSITLRIMYTNSSGGESTFFTETKICESNSINSISINGIAPIATGIKVYPKIINNSSSNTISILTSTSSSYFSGFLVD